MKSILVTGGLGFVGSHVVVELTKSEYNPIIIDNLSNSNSIVLRKLEEITQVPIDFIEGDINDQEILNKIFSENSIFSVIHLAGSKAVGESVRMPLKYYQNNVGGAMTLLKVMDDHGVRNFIFSSSATVYGDPVYLPIDEKHPVGKCSNPYGRTKFVIETILTDLCASNSAWRAISLRYFNPIGNHESGLIGEDPVGIPNNLLPYVTRVCKGSLPVLPIYGQDYLTLDGTGVRDYIHVVDVAVAHVKALAVIEERIGHSFYNLGTGNPYSVLQVVESFQKVAGKQIPCEFKPRREGDVASCYADCSLSQKELNWKAQYNIDDMCESLWKWINMNPTGYQSNN
uniref:UDP-glucose 4-epimerase n=1 Tax=Dicyema japonicum TaxID=399803 RepID=B9ZYW4_DICJA|nr:UDP-glucose 4-epimerase [Dicyema japonicum]